MSVGFSFECNNIIDVQFEVLKNEALKAGFKHITGFFFVGDNRNVVDVIKFVQDFSYMNAWFKKDVKNALYFSISEIDDLQSAI